MKRGVTGRLARRQQGFAVGLLLIVMAAVALVLFLVGSSYGAALLLRLGLGLAGEGRAGGVQGSLYQGLSVAELRFQGQGLGVVADGLRIEVDWWALRQGQLRVVEASVARLQLDLPPPAPDDPAAPAPQMPSAPAWPELPLTVSLHYVALGELRLRREGEALPFALDHTALRAFADSQGLRAQLLSLNLETPEAGVVGHGELTLRPPAAGALAEREPASAVPELALSLTAQVRQGEQQSQANLSVQGPLNHLQAHLVAQGYDLSVEAQATLDPFSATLPLQALVARVRGVRPEAWLPGLPPALLNLDLDLALSGQLWPAEQLGAVNLDALQSRLQLSVQAGSRWQGQAVQGQVRWQQQGWWLPELEADLRLGTNRVQLQGAVGAAGDTLRYTVSLPAPAQVWPGLAGSLDLRGEFAGLPAQHRLTLQGQLQLPPGLLPAPSPPAAPELVAGEMIAPPANPEDVVIDLPAALSVGPYQIDLALAGRWGEGEDGSWQAGRAAWRGQIERLGLRNPELGLSLRDRLPVALAVPTETAPLAWQVGAGRLQLALPNSRTVVLAHQGSHGSGAQWHSAGAIDNLIPAWVVAQLPRSPEPLQLDLRWDLGVEQALQGEVSLRRRGGDLTLPAEPPLSLGLQTLTLTLQATPRQPGLSDVRFNLDLAGRRLGSLRAEGQTQAVLQHGVPLVTEAQAITLDARLALDDLSWLAAFTGDENEVGGRLQGDVRLERTRGEWQATGTLRGDDLRVIRIDDGVRLLNGTLRARFTQDRIQVDSLRFEGAIRSAPRNAAVQAWVAEYGKQGYIQASGAWSLTEAAGEAQVEVSRYPLVQRADRFVAASGNIQVAASPRRFEISGKVVADIGWISLEGSDELPSLSSDVVVVRTGEAVPTAESLPLRLNLDIDFGNKMMLTGLGLNTELTGSINVRNARSGLRANGVVNTRDGRFSIYGQTLVVRQGTVTFQGLLDDPLLDIVAVRPNLQVEAGVQISGTARNPIITLVSFPEVPEEEQLSWLLLGRGPDSRGADTGLLLSAAASLLGNGGDPFYQQFGLDELGLRSGTGSGVRGILPDRTVVGSLSSSANPNDVGQFLVAGKRLSDSLYLTFEQALSGRAAVLRASYRLSERLSASVQGGTINGLRLVWSLLW